MTYPPTLYNTQRLLFDATRPVRHADPIEVPDDYYERGWTLLDGIADEREAVAVQESLIRGIDVARLPLHARFADRVQLGKADLIPVCDDVVATSFQVLHFDMGLPFADGPDQLLVTHVGIYLPATTAHAVTARTRLVELGSVLADKGLDVDAVERRILDYARRHGDGWAEYNTYRLACFVRIVDALAESPELGGQVDKTVGQWFLQDEELDAVAAHAQETAFYSRHGIDIGPREREVALAPGQLLVLDNTRVVHGRVGQRRAREVYNFMFGVPAVGGDDVAALRRHICELVAA
ncbi:MAG TPA: hypothetical protein VGW75_09295 [Solirubrobacteraceae bacterium]|jgi:hypothetical protein|nr:hypothetical protein [Solirubrobacteraceae bacterium]